MSNLSNNRGVSMFLRLNVREANLLNALASGGAAGDDARTLTRLQRLGLVNSNRPIDRPDPVTPEGFDWIRKNPTLPVR